MLDTLPSALKLVRTVTFTSSDGTHPPAEELELLLDELELPVALRVTLVRRLAASYSIEVTIPAGLVCVATCPAALYVSSVTSTVSEGAGIVAGRESDVPP